MTPSHVRAAAKVHVYQTGPVTPPDEVMRHAIELLVPCPGTRPVCMDCDPDIQLSDTKESSVGWVWVASVLHDDTCPAINGHIPLPTRNPE